MATSKKETARVALPGRMYKKEDRWWWSVQLPGEARCRARALRAPKERTATTDRRMAEAAALTLWKEAIEREARSEILAETKNQSTEKGRAYSFLFDRLAERAKPSYRQAPWTVPSTFQVQVASDQDTTVYHSIKKLPPYQPPVRQQVSPVPDPEAGLDSDLCFMEILSESSTMHDCHGCECCGSKDFFDEYLQTAENGQKLCPRCVQAMLEDTPV